MGVMFKISKTGRKFRPKISTESVTPDSPEQLNPKPIVLSAKSKAIVESRAGDVSEFAQSSLIHVSPDHEVSFVLSLYPNGYSIGKPSEAVQQTSFRDAQKVLHPYDRAAESLLSAVEVGRLHVDILEDIQCKFVDGGGHIYHGHNDSLEITQVCRDGLAYQEKKQKDWLPWLLEQWLPSPSETCLPPRGLDRIDWLINTLTIAVLKKPDLINKPFDLFFIIVRYVA
ncbi:hypothetical protein Bca52824_014985 [Brassica carinata]|uniref:Spt20-like SEP domain-containing protein n=1 Tax=Brassica carinata TaxID=52824 RepID=A0A8X8B4Y4_BRACI|nr:hypothetical protein Bca52824_014985 [Brassica carinata]